MSTFSRSEFPPGGWLFYQPETKWNAPNPTIDSFGQTLLRIQSHRRANPQANLSVDLDDIEADLVAFTEARIGKKKVAVPYAPLPDKPKKRSGCKSCGR